MPFTPGEIEFKITYLNYSNDAGTAESCEYSERPQPPLIVSFWSIFGEEGHPLCLSLAR